MANNESTKVDDVAKKSLEGLMTDYQTTSQGLAQEEADNRLKKYGENTIQAAKKRSEILIFVENFTSMMAILLWASGIIAMFAGMLELGVAIWTVNVINGCFSYWQQHAAQKATDSLKKMLPSYVKVTRNGSVKQIREEELVPGDLFALQAGDSIPADARIFNCSNLQVDESSLTGESVPVDKGDQYQHGDGEFAQNNIVFAGTTVTSGTASGIVFATGMTTEFGRIAQLTQNQKKVMYPLQRELNQLTRQLTLIAVLIGVAFFLLAILFCSFSNSLFVYFCIGHDCGFHSGRAFTNGYTFSCSRHTENGKAPCIIEEPE